MYHAGHLSVGFTIRDRLLGHLYRIQNHLLYTFPFIRYLYTPILETTPPRTHYCRLCEKCERITGFSRLLAGSPWIFTGSSETHTFHTMSELRASSKRCHLCQILLESIQSFKGDDTEYPESDLSQRECQNSIGHGQATQESDAFARPACITLKIWVSRYIFKSPALKMQLLGPSIVKSLFVDIVSGKKHSIPS